MKKPSRPAPNISHFSWLEYSATICVMALLTMLPALLMGGIDVIRATGWRYFLWYILLWAGVALLFCAMTAWQKYQAFDKPMRLLGDAARKVASGDFSVYIKPLHPAKNQKYVDIMFQDFNTMVEELGSTETMKNDFIANVSHEFKTPLSVIQNYAMGLKTEELDEEKRQEYLDTILTSAENLTTMVTNILRLNKLENQAIAVRHDAYDLCQQICDCIIAFEEKWDAKPLSVEAELEDLVMVEADGDMLSLVWNNLLSNAIKFTPPCGSVTFRQTSNDHTVTVSITDTGCGMDEATVRHIFDKFYQRDTSHCPEGNGLGLALVKRVVE